MLQKHTDQVNMHYDLRDFLPNIVL